VSVSQEPVSFEPDWSSAEPLPLVPVNQFVTQLGPAAGAQQVPDGIYLTLGTAAPPIFLGSPQRVAQQTSEYGSQVHVAAVARLVLTRERAQEMASLLMTAVSQYDAAAQTGKGLAGDDA